MIHFRVAVPPRAEPVSIEAALQQVCDDGGGVDETLLARLVSAARQAAEEYRGESLSAQTLEAGVDCFPGGCAATGSTGWAFRTDLIQFILYILSSKILNLSETQR